MMEMVRVLRNRLEEFSLLIEEFSFLIEEFSLLIRQV